MLIISSWPIHHLSFFSLPFLSLIISPLAIYFIFRLPSRLVHSSYRWTWISLPVCFVLLFHPFVKCELSPRYQFIILCARLPHPSLPLLHHLLFTFASFSPLSSLTLSTIVRVSFSSVCFFSTYPSVCSLLVTSSWAMHHLIFSSSSPLCLPLIHRSLFIFPSSFPSPFLMSVKMCVTSSSVRFFFFVQRKLSHREQYITFFSSFFFLYSIAHHLHFIPPSRLLPSYFRWKCIRPSVYMFYFCIPCSSIFLLVFLKSHSAKYIPSYV